MQEQNIQTHTFGNGLTLVVEPMSDVQSAAFSLLVPGGSIYDPPNKNGTASVLCELMTRGAADRDSQRLSADLDNLGLQRSENVGGKYLTFSGATLAENLAPVLKIYADIVQRPRLPAEQFEAARGGVEQTLRALEDEPRQKVIIELRRRCYNSPWGLPSDGSLGDLDAISIDSAREQFDRCLRPNEAILGIAGRVQFDQLMSLVEEEFGSWDEKPELTFESGSSGPSLDQIHHESTQTHIGIAYDAVPYRDPDYYAAWAAVSILSGGMSSRLFTEVRERRGLCYSIYATLNSLPDEGRVLCYAGTTTERAQETLDITLGELVRLQDGIEEGELDRCRARAKSSLIMQQESTIARSSAIARDWFHLGRVTTLKEVRDKIEALTVEHVLNYVRQHPARDFTILTIGPQPLEPS